MPANEPKAHLRRPEDRGRTYCGRTLPPWRTFEPAEVNPLIAEAQIGLTDAAICGKCREKANLPYSGAAAEAAARKTGRHAAGKLTVLRETAP